MSAANALLLCSCYGMGLHGGLGYISLVLGTRMMPPTRFDKNLECTGEGHQYLAGVVRSRAMPSAVRSQALGEVKLACPFPSPTRY